MCHKQLDFGQLFNLDIVVDFKGGEITSDGGGLLLKEIGLRYRITEAVAAELTDDRQAGKINHSLLDLLCRRIYQIALG